MTNKRKRQLNKKQLAMLNDMFTGQFDEQTVLDRQKISRALYNKWRADEDFIAEFDRRITWLYRQSRALIASYTRLAAAKLVELTNSEKEETARKACLDIITMSPAQTQQSDKDDQSQQQQPPPQISRSMARKLLATLAQTKESK